MLLLLFLLAGVTDTLAQNVTISPTSGNLVAAYTESSSDYNEVGFEKGWCAMWRHEQLPLTFTVSDYPELLPNGEIKRPAGNISKYQKTSTSPEYLVIGGGATPDLYCVLSLPKGYRITGYKLVLVNNLNNTTVNGVETGSVTNVMYETDNLYNYEGNSYKARGKYANGTYEMGPTDSEDEYVIERTSLTDTDMSNQLYFRLTHNVSAYYDVTIKSFEVWFTAEGTFPVTVSATDNGQAKSLVTTSFQTSKIDVGAITKNTRTPEGGGDPVTFFSYSYKNVKDLDGEIYLYQKDAVNENGEPADVAENKHIYTVKTGDNQYQYAFENDEYYVEPPTLINTSSGASCPIGYRVVGATFKYMWGDQVDPTYATLSAGSCDIQYVYRYYGETYTYHLQTSQNPSLSNSTYYWAIDELGNIYYTSNKGTKRYLACSGEGDYRTVTTSTKKDNKFNLRRDSEGRIYYDSGNNKYYLGLYSYWGDTYLGVIKNATSNLLTSTVSDDAQQIEVGGFTPGQYTLKIYDKTGKNVEKEVTVKGKSDAGTYEMEPCNNDAVKFVITGLPNGTKAMVSVTLKLEALDPYINNMNIVCEDQPKQLQMSQTFTANDFRVSGGEFEFYVPQKYQGQDIDLSFAELYSNYGDSTYYENTESIHRSRYSFVTSDYFTHNQNLYDANYNPNSAYTNKVIATKAGNIRFKFNNAEDLVNTNLDAKDRYLMEYPFSYKDYIGSDDPDNPSSTPKGNYIDCTVKAGDGTQDAGSFFVFTADEPKYNIAPGYKDGEEVKTPHAWQHRSYAFYRMDIKVTAKNFTPVLEWKKVYDKTCYQKNGKEAEDSMWGLTLKTKDGNNEVKGYLSYDDVIDNIRGREASGSGETAIPAIASQLDKNNTNAPATMKQILYIDATNLLSMATTKEKVATAEGEEEEKTISHDVNELKDSIGENALIFLPLNNTAKADNVAYMTISNTFRAGRNIVLTDLKPFYSPYNIQVDAANLATYTRNVTVGKNGKVTSATIIMPFEIAVDATGKHTNVGDTEPTFSLHQMQATYCMKTPEPGALSYAFFPNIKLEAGVQTAAANTPYLVNVLNPSEENNVSFVISQKGTLIKATGKKVDDDYRFVGEIAQGTVKHDGEKKNTTYNFTNYGSYSGKKIAKAETIFYFAHNTFLSSKELMNSDYVKIAPFRTYYETAVSSNNAKLASFDIFFGEGEGNGTTGINTLNGNPDLKVVAGNGAITFTSTIDQNVRVNGVSGVLVENANLQAGETRTINVPAGMYIINGVKIIVK